MFIGLNVLLFTLMSHLAPFFCTYPNVHFVPMLGKLRIIDDHPIAFVSPRQEDLAELVLPKPSFGMTPAIVLRLVFA